MAGERIGKINRETKETQIDLKINLDGNGVSEISTGIPFLDHMLELFSRHGLFDLNIKAIGDLDVDYHHLVEDIGIALGKTVKSALGDKRGIKRYGFFILPMDECLVRVVLDLSGRTHFVYNVNLSNHYIRDFNVGLIKEFFQAFANSAGANLHITLEYGEEPHHISEGIFKSFSRALDVATAIDLRLNNQLPSTKGTLS